MKDKELVVVEVRGLVGAEVGRWGGRFLLNYFTLLTLSAVLENNPFCKLPFSANNLWRKGLLLQTTSTTAFPPGQLHWLLVSFAFVRCILASVEFVYSYLA